MCPLHAPCYDCFLSLFFYSLSCRIKLLENEEPEGILGSRGRVRLRSMSVRRKRSSRATLTSDSDDFTDDEPHSHPKRRPSGGINQEILEEIRGICQDITTLAQQTRLTLELCWHLPDAFKCKICQDVPMKPPIVSTGCCKRLL